MAARTTGMLPSSRSRTRSSIGDYGDAGDNSSNSSSSSSNRNRNRNRNSNSNSNSNRSSSSSSSSSKIAGLRLVGIGLATSLVLVNLSLNLSSMHHFELVEKGSETRKQQHHHHHQQQQQQRPIPYYRAWDPVRGMLDPSMLPELGIRNGEDNKDNSGTDNHNHNRNRNRNHNRNQHRSNKPAPKTKTSFELLQEILHEHNNKDGETTVDGSLRRNRDRDRNRNRNRPSCFAPDFERTHRAVTFAREQWAKQQQEERSRSNSSSSNSSNNNDNSSSNNNNIKSSNRNNNDDTEFVPIGLPLLNMGMPKSGSSTLLRFVRHDLRWKATHNIVESPAAAAAAAVTTVVAPLITQQLSPRSEQHQHANANANANAHGTRIRTRTGNPQKHAYVGKLMKQAVDEGLGSPFALLPPTYRAHTQMDYTLVSTSQSQSQHNESNDNDNDQNTNNNNDNDNDGDNNDGNFFPQISLLDEIHSAEPNATFVLLFRPVDDWIRSVRSWHRLPVRWMEETTETKTTTTTTTTTTTAIPGLTLTPDQALRRESNPGEPLLATESQLEEFWCHHVEHVRRFADEHPSHLLIELDLYDNNNNNNNNDNNNDNDNYNGNSNGNGNATRVLLREIFFPPGSRKAVTWGKANANPGAATSAGSRPGGPIARSIKYYEQWNHTSQRLQTEAEPVLNGTNGSDSDSNIDSDSDIDINSDINSDSDSDIDSDSDSENDENQLPRKRKHKHKHKHKPTSLELLETILAQRRARTTPGKDDQEEDECFRTRPLARGDSRRKNVNGNGNVNDNDNDNSNNNATAELQFQFRLRPQLLHYPILNVGLPMDPWSDALRDFFSCLGLRVVHRKALGSNGKRRIGSVGKKMREAVKDAHIGPLSGFFGNTHRQAFTALDYTPSLNSNHSSVPAASSSSPPSPPSTSQPQAIFPQIQLLDELHEEDPSLTFVLPMPPIDEWVAWAQTFHNFTERWARMEMPGLVLTEEQRRAMHGPCPELGTAAGTAAADADDDDDPRRCLRLSDDQLRDWWCGHVGHVRSFVETYDHSHALLELDLSEDHRESTTSALNDWFGIDGDGDHHHCAAELFGAAPFPAGR